jgi:sulfatase maturation enzyme AslB (radical SAM superfamily)
MAVASAKTVHQHMNLMKRIASLIWLVDAQFLALVIGANLTNALPSFRFQEASLAVEAQKQELTSSLRRRRMEVQNAATNMERRMHRTAAIVHVKCLALASSPNGAIVAPRVVEGPCHESLKSHNRQCMVAQIALIIMATKRLRHVAMTRAPFLVKDLGVNGPNAVNNALTVRAMVPLARSRANTPSL